MGQFSAQLIEQDPGLDLVCRVTSGQDLAEELEQSQPQVGLDFTRAGLGRTHGELLLRAGVRPVIGTSGLQPDDDAALHGLALERGLAGLVVPNFSIGVWLQQQLALIVSKHMQHVEITEEHNIHKADAPSGTAVDTALQLAAALNRPPDTIPVHSVRLPGLYSNQTVLFGAPGQILRLTHETYSLHAFGPGVLAALHYVADAPAGVLRGIGHALEKR